VAYVLKSVYTAFYQRSVLFLCYVTEERRDESSQRLSNPGCCDDPHVPRQDINSVSTSGGTQKEQSSGKRTGNL